MPVNGDERLQHKREVYHYKAPNNLRWVREINPFAHCGRRQLILFMHKYMQLGLITINKNT